MRFLGEIMTTTFISTPLVTLAQHRNTHSKSQCAYYTQVQASLHRAFDADAGLEAAGIQLAQNISLQRAYKSGSVQITRATRKVVSADSLQPHTLLPSIKVVHGGKAFRHRACQHNAYVPPAVDGGHTQETTGLHVSMVNPHTHSNITRPYAEQA